MGGVKLPYSSEGMRFIQLSQRRPLFYEQDGGESEEAEIGG